MLRTRVFEWNKRLKGGYEEVKYDTKIGRLTTSRTAVNVEQINQIVCRGHRLKTEKCSEDYLRRMREICTKMIPKLLNDDQKKPLILVCQDIIKRLQTEPDMLHIVVAGDETWILGYNPETKRQNNQWKSPTSLRPKKNSKNQKSAGAVKYTDCISAEGDKTAPSIWAVWHSCRMGARNQEQTRGRIGPQFRLGNLRVGELHFCPLCTALDQARGLSRKLAYVPGPTFGFVKLLASSGSHCTKWADEQHRQAGFESRLVPDLPLPFIPTLIGLRAFDFVSSRVWWEAATNTWH